MKCPWTRRIQKKVCQQAFDQNGTVSNAETMISEFGECVRTECPFFEIATHYCRRTKM